MATAVKTWRRPTAADLLALARQRFMHGERLDLQGLAEELGVSRATAYRWAGDAEQLSGQVIASLMADTFQNLRRAARGKGAERVLDVVVSGMRAIARFTPYRQFLEHDPQRALRIVASKEGPVQKNTIRLHQELLEEEIHRGHLRLPVDAHTMAYALTRIVESFLYADIIAGEEPDLEKAEKLLQLMLHVERRPASARQAVA